MRSQNQLIRNFSISTKMHSLIFVFKYLYSNMLYRFYPAENSIINYDPTPISKKQNFNCGNL